MAGSCTILTYPLGLFKLCLYLKYSVSTNDNLWLNIWVRNVFWSKPHLSSGAYSCTDSATWNLGLSTIHHCVSDTYEWVIPAILVFWAEFFKTGSSSMAVICTVDSDFVGTDKLSLRYIVLQEVGGGEKKICLL